MCVAFLGSPMEIHSTCCWPIAPGSTYTQREASFDGEPAGGAAAAAAQAATRLTYRQRVAAAFISFLCFYDHIHRGHTKKASALDDQERSALADTAVCLAVELQRAVLCLIGTHRRRTYAHDLVYGLHRLYKLFSKPWNAACEGSEHAHQEIKAFYANMVCHSDKRVGHSDAYEILRLRIVKSQILADFGGDILPHSAYAAARADKMWAQAAAKSGPQKGVVKPMIGTKMVVHKEEDSAMMAVAKAVKAAEALQGSPNRRGHGAS